MILRVSKGRAARQPCDLCLRFLTLFHAIDRHGRRHCNALGPLQRIDLRRQARELAFNLGELEGFPVCQDLGGRLGRQFLNAVVELDAFALQFLHTHGASIRHKKTRHRAGWGFLAANAGKMG